MPSSLPGVTSRRAFLQSVRTLIPAGAAYQVTPTRITPVRTQTEGPPGHAHAAIEGPLAAALAARVETLKGFDPRRTLSAFDWGDASTSRVGQVVRTYHIAARDVDLEIAPGVFVSAWTHNGLVPGPTLRCRAGDRVRVEFSNESAADHTMHFHGIHPADMDGTQPVVRPGSRYVYEFDAEPAGLHLYHCHVPPVALHMSRGMYGVFIVDPPNAWPAARELVLVLSAWDIDFDARNEIYAINGCANYFRDHPIELDCDERVRVFLVNAVEYDPICSFHVHGNFFDVTGGAEPARGLDTICLSQGERRVLELSYKFSGLFMFHPHQNTFAERGAMGHFLVKHRDR
jgi:FtsP/CotA-like multicopper oxidase with cupredoxin domain